MLTQISFQRESAVDLVAQAIESGIFNDLGSGSNVDVCVITKDKTDYLRNYRRPNERAVKEETYTFPKGTTAYSKESIWDLVVKEDNIDILVPDPETDAAAGEERMDTS